MTPQILNEKTDEDAEENRRNSADGNRGVSQPSALLSQLLSSSNGPSGNGRPHDSSENYLERMAAVKRKFDDAKGMSSSSKRATPENQQVKRIVFCTNFKHVPSQSLSVVIYMGYL